MNTFRANCPAHIAINYIWLNVFEMRDLEDLYTDWLSDLRRKDNPRELDRLSSELAWMLNKYIGRSDQ
jgi:hypothetical protein